MAEIGRLPGAAFAECHVEADGIRVRCLEAGRGPALIHLPGASEPRSSRAHDLLAHQFRVVVVEVPGASPADRRSALTLGRFAHVATALGVERFALMGTAGGTALALRLAIEHADRIEALVLESPTAPALEPDLSTLATPTLVLFGTRDDAAPPDLGRRYRAVLPNAHLVYVYDATHAIGAERPEAFADLVTDFLVRREQFVVSRTSSLLHP